MADIQAFNHPSTSDNIEKGNPKGTGTIHNSVIDSKETSHTNAVFEDVEAHIRYKDFKTKQEFSGAILAWLTYQSIGVIYGDIGTSPLYVFSSTFTSSPSNEDLIGALSLIIWALTLVVTLKYVTIVLFADDDGEGGTFALYSLLTRYCDIMQRSPREPLTVKLERQLTQEMKGPNAQFRSVLENNFLFRTFIKFLAVFGVCLVIADGILTPAQSVLGAIQGLKVKVPDIETNTIVGISCAILIVLFLIQPLGITKLGTTFAPIVVMWLLFNMVFGIYNLVKFDASVLRAFNPANCFYYFNKNGEEGWKSLGAILLCFTGVEALFADLGAFSARFGPPEDNLSNWTTSLGNAYGVCVIMVTFITTCMVSIVALVVWQLHFLFVLAGFIFFGAIDGAFLSAALTKVPQGAWFTLLLALLLSCVLFLWRFGKKEQWKTEVDDNIAPSSLVVCDERGRLMLQRSDGQKEMGRIKGVGIFFDKIGYHAPAVYTHFVRKFEAQHEVIVFFHLRQLIQPTVREEERYIVQRVGSSNTFRIIVRHGYNDHVFTENFGVILYDKLKAFLDAEIENSGSELSLSNAHARVNARALRERDALDAAYEKQVIYILGKEQLRLSPKSILPRRFALSTFIWMRENTRTKQQEFNVPIDQLVEVGYIKEI
ncbi:uncharacterized protein H6S33_007529 [Morchella sextelata]|uniref:uncharacterized protein n=1 Tax=Morchella sextelata TaxID=1174677 RepID=UPI001D05538E|nr:uncharacterized protein H6S33_007529 [Morchella sextelata]KAH0603870.1 hypothetical protein H6S33_007529 [Morchella sextelata]